MAGVAASNWKAEWGKAAGEIDKRRGNQVMSELGKSLTAATEVQRRKVGESFRESVSEGTPSGFAPSDIDDPLTKVWASGQKVNARLQQRGKHNYWRWNKGGMNHPVFGNREAWAPTAVPRWKGMWGRATKPVAAETKALVVAAMDRWFQQPGR